MKIVICCVGSTDVTHVQDAVDVYTKRLKHYIPVEINIIPEQKQWKKLSADPRKKAEGEAILSHLLPGDHAILLDEKGKQYTSEGFAEFLQKKMGSGAKRLVFIIGGAYGFSPGVYAAVPDKISLSKMTFSHQMIRGFLLEQIYRGMSILKKEPYHNR